MQKFFDKNKTLEQTYKENRVKEYINKYIKELQRHFDLPDNKMRMILYKVYKELSPFSFIKTWISMVKSKYIERLKERIYED